MMWMSLRVVSGWRSCWLFISMRQDTVSLEPGSSEYSAGVSGTIIEVQRAFACLIENSKWKCVDKWHISPPLLFYDSPQSHCAPLPGQLITVLPPIPEWVLMVIPMLILLSLYLTITANLKFVVMVQNVIDHDSKPSNWDQQTPWDIIAAACWHDNRSDTSRYLR